MFPCEQPRYTVLSTLASLGISCLSTHWKKSPSTSSRLSTLLLFFPTSIEELFCNVPDPRQTLPPWQKTFSQSPSSSSSSVSIFSGPACLFYTHTSFTHTDLLQQVRRLKLLSSSPSFFLLSSSLWPLVHSPTTRASPVSKTHPTMDQPRMQKTSRTLLPTRSDEQS